MINNGTKLSCSKFSVGFLFGIETSEFPTYQNGLWLITNPPPQLFETSELSNQLYALTIGRQIGKSPFNLKIALGTNNYNFEKFHVHVNEVSLSLLKNCNMQKLNSSFSYEILENE